MPNCSEYRTQLNARSIKDYLSEGVSLRWVHSGAQLADGLTKIMENAFLRETLQYGYYKLHDELEVLRDRATTRNRLKWLRSGNKEITDSNSKKDNSTCNGHVQQSGWIFVSKSFGIFGSVNHTICCTLSLVALRKPRTFNTVSHQNASDPVAPLQAQGAPFSGQWVGKGFSAWPFSFGRARRPLERLIGISRIAGGIEAGIIYHCLFLGVVKPWSLAIVEKVAVLGKSCQWGWTFLVNHNIHI